jgi:sn-glycerol 3-phosphate transport system permease protein
VAGLVGHYAALITLAGLVILPILLTLFNAMSTPIDYITASEPWRPVAVGWKDRDWLSGGTTSVLGRSLALLFALAWVQLKAARGNARNLTPLRDPRRLLAIASGFAAIAILTGQILGALVDRSPSTPGWFVGSMAVVALTQVPGLVRVSGNGSDDAHGRPVWRVVAYSAVIGSAFVTVVVVAVGAEVWTDAWDQGRLGPALTRSLVMSLLIVSCQVVTSVFAAYAFAFLRFPLKGLAFAFVMASLLLPIEVTLLGNVQTIRDLGWTDSYQGLVLPFAATGFGTFLIRQGFKGIPPEIRDAARLDGYGHLSFMWRFAVPLTRPVIGAFTVVAAMVAWNQYLWPQAVIDDQRQETAQIALKSLEGAIENANIRIASALIISLPVVLLLVAFQRQIIRGLTAGAVK